MGVFRRVNAGQDPRKAVREGGSRGAYLAGEHIIGVAAQDAPVDEGTLRNSGATTPDGLTCVMSFDTPYAKRQHEEMGYKHPRGGGPKFLERAMNNEADVARALIVQAIRKQLSQ